MFAAVLAAGAATDACAADAAAQELRVVYHVNDVANAREALVNIANQLAADPHAKIALVANGRGIYMLVNGEKDRVGEYATTIAELEAKGVRFDACHNSMVQKHIEASSLVQGVVVVPAGVGELTRLQAVEHYAYIKP
jgi:intracellular sulfur oxidation DsrE/DsrF family protein